MEPKNIKKEYWHKGIVAFTVVAALILFFFFLYRFDIVKSGISKVFTVLQPVIFGLVISYLLNPLVDIFNEKVFPKIFGKDISAGKKKLVNFLSVFISLLIFTLIIVGIFVLIIPGISNSVQDIISVAPKKVDSFIKWGDRFIDKNKSAAAIYEKAVVLAENWMKSDMLSVINKSADYLLFGVLGVVNFLKNFAIGFLISIYLLYNKKEFGNKSRKVLFAIFKEKNVKKILSVLSKSNSVFSGFIYAKILDSLIIGVLCFIGVAALGIPYKVLVATIICVTNIIPVFGPYIGAIPCSLLILANNPIKGIYFIIFIILLQTLDGNVLGPKILGDKTGIDTFWVIFAIIVGGGLFGVIGMLIGVPVFAVIYYFMSTTINDALVRKKLSTNCEDYNFDRIITDEVRKNEKK